MANVYPIQQKDGSVEFRSRGILNKNKSGAGKNAASANAIVWSSCQFVTRENPGGGDSTTQKKKVGGGGSSYEAKPKGVQYALQVVGYESSAWSWTIKPHYVKFSRPCNPNAAPSTAPASRKKKWHLPTDSEMAAHVPTFKELLGGTASPSEILEYADRNTDSVFETSESIFHNVGRGIYESQQGYEALFGVVRHGVYDTMHGDPFAQLDGAEFYFGNGEGLIDGLIKDSTNE